MMGKVKEQLMLSKEQEFKEELSYQEYFQEKLSEDEIKEMAREILEPYIMDNFYLYVYSVNNIEYKSGLSTS